MKIFPTHANYKHNLISLRIGIPKFLVLKGPEKKQDMKVLHMSGRSERYVADPIIHHAFFLRSESTLCHSELLILGNIFYSILFYSILPADHSLCQANSEARHRHRTCHLYNLHVLAELEKVGGFTYEIHPKSTIVNAEFQILRNTKQQKRGNPTQKWQS